MAATTKQGNEVQFFMRHVIPIFLHFAKEEREHTALMTTCLVSIRGRWLLFTAGHCITDVKAMLSLGWSLKRSRLIDTLSLSATFSHLVPFDYEAAAPSALCKNEKNDYGVLFVDDNLRALLEANGAMALTEDAWQQQPEAPDGYFMAGVLGTLSNTTPDTAMVTSGLVGVREVKERPNCFEATDAFRWYGRVALDDGVRTLEGMSGGPIFSMKRGADGALRYWLHALQSAQAPNFPTDPFIAANLTLPLAGFLAEFMQGQHQHLVEPEGDSCAAPFARYAADERDRL